MGIELRIKIFDALEEFTRSALIVMVEDHWSEELVLPNTSEKLWMYKVKTSTFDLYKRIMSGQWFSLPVGVLLHLHRNKGEYLIYPHGVLTPELDRVPSSMGELSEITMIHDQHPEYHDYLTESWAGDVVDQNTFSEMLATISNDLVATEGSYVKDPHFRQHRALVESLLKNTTEEVA